MGDSVSKATLIKTWRMRSFILMVSLRLSRDANRNLQASVFRKIGLDRDQRVYFRFCNRFCKSDLQKIRIRTVDALENVDRCQINQEAIVRASRAFDRERQAVQVCNLCFQQHVHQFFVGVPTK
jgi:hypothetical protein